MRKLNKGSVAIYLAITLLIIGILGAGGIFIRQELAKNEARREEQGRLFAEQMQRLQQEEDVRQEAASNALLERRRDQEEEQARRDAEIQRLQTVVTANQQGQQGQRTLTQEEYDAMLNEARDRQADSIASNTGRVESTPTATRPAQNQRTSTATARESNVSPRITWRCSWCRMEAETNSLSIRPPGAFCKRAPALSGKTYTGSSVTQGTRTPHRWAVVSR